jgi:hypothetical protein
VRVTDNRWARSRHGVCKYGRHGREPICAGTRRFSKRDSILSHQRSVPWVTLELVPPDMEYSTITSIKSLEICLRASANITKVKKRKWCALGRPTLHL